MTDYEQAYRRGDIADVEGRCAVYMPTRWEWLDGTWTAIPTSIGPVLGNVYDLASSAPATASEGATCGARVRSADYTHGPHRHDDGVLTLTGVTSSDGDRGLSEEGRMAAISDEAVRVAEEVWSEDEPTLAEYELTERILAARTARPEGVERVEWSTWIAREQRGYDDRADAQRRAERDGSAVVRRTVTEFAPVVGPWEVVGDE